ncbi:ribosome-inactivating family protein [Streptomyces sp. HUAS MG91]|uniref:Ribosome-inactivating family protein n=1 Tax=Streptomyces tabacisoli TaxID=3156398 RepID=A0AAU8IL50_9ACTN
MPAPRIGRFVGAATLALCISLGGLMTSGSPASAQIPEGQETDVHWNVPINEVGPTLADDYDTTIRDLRNLVAVPSSDGGQQTQNTRALLSVTLFIPDHQNTTQLVTLYFQASDLYLMGFSPGYSRNAYMFNDWQSDTYGAELPDGMTPRNLRFGGSYGSLSNVDGADDRYSMRIGYNNIWDQILHLATTPEDQFVGTNAATNARTASALLQMINMFSESARFPDIQAHYRDAFRDPSAVTQGLTPFEQEAETSWGALSNAFYRLNQDPTTSVTLVVGPLHIVYNNRQQIRNLLALLAGSTRIIGTQFDKYWNQV